MKREIKFRALDDGKIIYSHNNSINTNNFQLKWFFEKIRQDAIVMQFTGLYDIHGKEIYEGDTVKWGHREGAGSEHWTRVAFVEINPDIQFRILYYIVTATCERKESDGYVFRYGNFAYKNTEKYLEIIGNEYE